MRYCEAGACTQPAAYRGPKDGRGAGAWCAAHVPTAEWNPQAPSAPKGLAPGIEPIPTAKKPEAK